MDRAGYPRKPKYPWRFAPREPLMGYTAGISTSRQHFSDKCAGGNYINGGLRETLQLLASDQADGLIVTKLDGPARSVVHAASIIEDAKVPRWSLVVLDS